MEKKKFHEVKAGEVFRYQENGTKFTAVADAEKMMRKDWVIRAQLPSGQSYTVFGGPEPRDVFVEETKNVS